MEFRGEFFPTKFGNKVLLYLIPNSANCYKFVHNNKGQDKDTYFCEGCKNRSNSKISVHAKDDLFLADPENINHCCKENNLFNTEKTIVELIER
jgi:hypothetical protein